MLLHNYIDVKELARRVEDKTISRRYHPKWPLAILNYTTTAMGQILHDSQVLRRCRGLIYNIHTNEILARPIKAFFNLNDERYPETKIENLPSDNFEITEKLDGSMGIIYQYKTNPPEVATRGSFESEQAKWATAYLQRCPVFYKPPEWTPLVEIIYPENKIVVDYKDRTGLILFAMVDISDGSEMTYNYMKKYAHVYKMFPPLEIIPCYSSKAIAQCAAENERNREGYVAKFFMLDLNLPPHRVKIKFEDYILSHRVVFGMHNRDVWELLQDGKPLSPDMFPFTPQGFKDWLQGQINYFTCYYNYLEYEVRRLIEAPRKMMLEGKWTRKDTAEFFKQQCITWAPWGVRSITPLLFTALDGKDLQAAIWKFLRPERAEGYKRIDVSPRPYMPVILHEFAHHLSHERNASLSKVR